MSNLGRRRDWTVLQLIEWSGQYLEEKGVERGRLDAEHLLAHAMSTTRLDLYLQYDRLLSGPELDQYRPLLTRRARREPLQYIVGRAGFRNLELEVDQAVLIPRPETEILVDEVLQWVSENSAHKLKILIPQQLFIDDKFNEGSLEEIVVYTEPHYLELKDGIEIQFIRFGYCRKDSINLAIFTHR